MNIKPMFDCVYIEQEVEKHDGLLVVPSSEKKLSQGTVVAVGPGIRTDHGDWIKQREEDFGRFAATTRNLYSVRQRQARLLIV